jgi:hypothetical protein
LFGRSEGQGTYIWQNQYKYVGVWVSNEWTVGGVFIWANSDWYEGGFVCGELHGNSIYSSSHGMKYVGQQIHGKCS